MVVLRSWIAGGEYRRQHRGRGQGDREIGRRLRRHDVNGELVDDSGREVVLEVTDDERSELLAADSVETELDGLGVERLAVVERDPFTELEPPRDAIGHELDGLRELRDDHPLTIGGDECLGHVAPKQQSDPHRIAALRVHVLDLRPDRNPDVERLGGRLRLRGRGRGRLCLRLRGRGRGRLCLRRGSGGWRRFVGLGGVAVATARGYEADGESRGNQQSPSSPSCASWPVVRGSTLGRHRSLPPRACCTLSVFARR